MDRIEEITDQSIRFIKSISQGDEVQVLFSGGKDSTILLDLVKRSGVPYSAHYCSTGIDIPGTIKFCEEHNVEIIRPKDTFFHLVERTGLPNRFKRWCCRLMKKRTALPLMLLGIRAAESSKRKKRYTEPIDQCRFGKEGELIVKAYPILFWTDDDVKAYVIHNGIRLHPHYYDKDGTLHTERRIGCIACPLMYYKRRREAIRQYPKFYIKLVKSFYVYMAKRSGGVENLTEDKLYKSILYDLTEGGRFARQAVSNETLFPDSYKTYCEDWLGFPLPDKEELDTYYKIRTQTQTYG